MSTASAARTAAETYINTEFSGTVSEMNLVGMTNTVDGTRVGFEIEIDKGTSIAGAILGGLFLGLLTLLIVMAFSILLSLAGVPPRLLIVVGLIILIFGIISGARNGADANKTENVTVTVDDAGDVIMMNRRLSPGEFSRAIDRSYDRQTSQFEGAIAQVSKHWLLHKAVDRFLRSSDKD